jgi:hypothetical protein
MNWQLFDAFGIFLGFTANLIVSQADDSRWRYEIASVVIPTLALLRLVFLSQLGTTQKLIISALYGRYLNLHDGCSKKAATRMLSRLSVPSEKHPSKQLPNSSTQTPKFKRKSNFLDEKLAIAMSRPHTKTILQAPKAPSQRPYVNEKMPTFNTTKTTKLTLHDQHQTHVPPYSLQPSPAQQKQMSNL